MRPLKPAERRVLIEKKPHMKPAQVESAIAEYESLLSESFKRDPTEPRSPRSIRLEKQRSNRIQELYHFLYEDEEEVG